MNPLYKEYSELLAEIFPGIKVQKISVNAGCSCPNRDGSISKGGCIYCDNRSFSPAYTQEISGISAQLDAGRRFFSRKYPDMKYLAYFQNYSGTYGDRKHLLQLYSEAVGSKDVAGLVIGTRPDCVDFDLLCEIKGVAGGKPVIMEYGAESMHDKTLRLINRHHTAEDVVRAADTTSRAGLHCALHLINFLPGEEEEEILATVERISSMPIESVKFHQLQVLRDTELARMIAEGELEYTPPSLERYLALCRRILNIIPRRIAIERFLSQSPPHMVLMPKWGLKNYEFIHKLKSQ